MKLSEVYVVEIAFFWGMSDADYSVDPDLKLYPIDKPFAFTNYDQALRLYNRIDEDFFPTSCLFEHQSEVHVELRRKELGASYLDSERIEFKKLSFHY